MTIKEIIPPNEEKMVKIYELNRLLTSPTMFGKLLYYGSLQDADPELLEREIFRIFDTVNTVVIIDSFAKD